MKDFDAQQDMNKQVEMYFDQVLDTSSSEELLQRVNSDPTWFQAFEREKNIREGIKKHIFRPVNSSQLSQAIKNQVLDPKK